MLKKTIKFNSFDGTQQSEDWYFNLTEAEVTRLEAEFPGGMVEYIQTFDVETEPDKILALFERLIRMSVGVKSSDGKRFVKSEEIVEDFMASAAYSALFVELVTDDKKAADFFNGVLTKTYIEPAKPKQS